MLLLALILTLQGAHGQSYSFVTDGHCTVPIANRAACDVAAQSLALADTSAIYTPYTLHTPPGRIFAEPSANFPNGNLFLNTASSYSGCSTSKACICVAVPSCTNTNGTAPNAEPCTCVQRGGATAAHWLQYLYWAVLLCLACNVQQNAVLFLEINECQLQHSNNL